MDINERDKESHSPSLSSGSRSPMKENLDCYGGRSLHNKLYLTLSGLYVPLLLAWVWLFFQYRQGDSVHMLSISQASGRSCTVPDMIPSPARESGAIQWETRSFPARVHNNSFAGSPRPELEHAWHEMLSGANIVVSGSDLERVNLTSLELADGSGYVIQPSMFHELHCLKRIRRWTYFDHYHGHTNKDALDEERAHIDHCIEIIRQAILCRADMSFSTFLYVEGTRSITVRDESQHQCVNGERLKAWLDKRRVNLYKKGVLKGQEDPV